MGLFATKLGQAYRLADGAAFADKVMNIGGGFSLAFQNTMPSLHPFDLFIGAACGGAFKAIIYFKSKNAKKYRKDIEYGSARFGTPADMKPYIDSIPENNIILTATESLTMNSRPKPVKYARNKNVLVIGGSGSGKTRFFVKPNIMQCDSKAYPVSFVITDPNGA
jgi:type IV secretion system protein VirD4